MQTKKCTSIRYLWIYWKIIKDFIIKLIVYIFNDHGRDRMCYLIIYIHTIKYLVIYCQRLAGFNYISFFLCVPFLLLLSNSVFLPRAPATVSSKMKKQTKILRHVLSIILTFSINERKERCVCFVSKNNILATACILPVLVTWCKRKWNIILRYRHIMFMEWFQYCGRKQNGC